MSPFTLLTEMAQELGVAKAKNESENEWPQRIILSACSSWLLGIIRGTKASNLTISYVRGMIGEKVIAYLELFQLGNESIENLKKDIVDYIFDTHASAGSFYHKPNYLCPAVEKINTSFGVDWCRSPIDPVKYNFSGLGTYNIHRGKSDTKTSCSSDLFVDYCLPVERPSEILSCLIKKRKWHPLNSSTSREFLHVFRKYGEGYYTTKRPDVNDILLAKEPAEYSNRFVLINNYSEYDIKMWEQEECYPDYVALGIMNKYQRLKANVLLDDKLTKLELNYTLPFSEERFLRLYAWPHSLYDLKNRWCFTIAPAIYPAVKFRLNHLGFTVKEVHL